MTIGMSGLSVLALGKFHAVQMRTEIQYMRPRLMIVRIGTITQKNGHTQTTTEGKNISTQRKTF